MKGRFEQKLSTLSTRETRIAEENARRIEARWLQERQRAEQIKNLAQKKPVEEAKKAPKRPPVPNKTDGAKTAGQQNSKLKVVNRAALLKNMLGR